MTDQGYPDSAPVELVEAAVSVDEALHQLGGYDDQRAVDTDALEGALELARWAIGEEIECWREPPPIGLAP